MHSLEEEVKLAELHRHHATPTLHCQGQQPPSLVALPDIHRLKDDLPPRSRPVLPEGAMPAHALEQGIIQKH